MGSDRKSPIPSDEGGGFDEAVVGMQEEDAGVTTGTNMASSTTTIDFGAEKLGVAPLAVIIFYAVSGGCFGVEETVRSAGSFWTLLGFLVMPMVWSVQEALLTAELATTFPEASGGVAWVTEAFGDRAGFMRGVYGWISGATDNAIYPVLFCEYLFQLLGKNDGDEINPFARYMILTSMSLVLAYTNWLGLNVVGKMAIVICCVAVSPFIIMTIVGIFQVDPSNWFLPPPAAEEGSNGDVGLFSKATLQAIAWQPFMNNLFWNLNHFDSAGNLSADIKDPSHVLPRALFWALIMVTTCYFVPLLVALGATDVSTDEWEDGYLSVVAKNIAGNWLGVWLVFAAGISNIAMFQAELSSDSFLLLGMAERGYIPKIFATRSKHGTPTYGIMLGTLVIVCMVVSDLSGLIELLNFNYAVALLMQYAAFFRLRIKQPNLGRPYRVPFGTGGCLLLFSPAVLATIVVMLLASWTTWLFCTCVTVFGFILIFLSERYLKHDVVKDEQEQPEQTTGVEFTDTPVAGDGIMT